MTDYKDPETNNKIAENRLRKFREFNKRINFSKQILYRDAQVPKELEEPKNFSDNYDYIILGSDQIWNYSYEEAFSDKCLGGFAPGYKRISFSASFGVDYIPKKGTLIYNICKKCLKDMKAISVREEAGKRIAKELTERNDIEVLLDPTMLLDTKEWEKIVKKPEQLKTDKFIVKNFLGDTSEVVEKELERVAKENCCEILDITDKNSQFYDIGPEEYLYLEKNAFLVATDSFHACVFSILFSTPFIVFKRQEKNIASMYSRIETILDTFNMKSCIFTGKIEKEKLNQDFSQVQTILNKERKKADIFMQKALN